MDCIDTIVQLQVEIAGAETDLDYLRSTAAHWNGVQDIDSTGGDWDEADRAEWHAWLDSLAPDCEECELRDAFLGHLD